MIRNILFALEFWALLSSSLAILMYHLYTPVARDLTPSRKLKCCKYSYLLVLCLMACSHQQTNSLQNFTIKEITADTGLRFPSSLVVGDIDGNGDASDFVLVAPDGGASGEGAVQIYQRRFTSKLAYDVTTLEGVLNPRFARLLDVNHDGRLDILVWSVIDARFYWYERTSDAFIKRELAFSNIPQDRAAQLPALCEFPGDVLKRQFVDVSHLELYDLDQDGDEDIIISQFSAEEPNSTNLVVFFAQTDAHFLATCIDGTQTALGISQFVIGKQAENARITVLPVPGDIYALDEFALATDDETGLPFLRATRTALVPLTPFGFTQIRISDVLAKASMDQVYAGGSGLVLDQNVKNDFSRKQLSALSIANILILQDTNDDAIGDFLLTQTAPNAPLLWLQSNPDLQYSAQEVLQNAGQAVMQLIDVDGNKHEDVVVVTEQGRVLLLQR